MLRVTTSSSCMMNRHLSPEPQAQLKAIVSDTAVLFWISFIYFERIVSSKIYDVCDDFDFDIIDALFVTRILQSLYNHISEKNIHYKRI